MNKDRIKTNVTMYKPLYTLEYDGFRIKVTELTGEHYIITDKAGYGVHYFEALSEPELYQKAMEYLVVIVAENNPELRRKKKKKKDRENVTKSSENTDT